MPRPQKFTDTDILAAIESLTAAGQTVNATSVRMRLGGGNVSRIKVVMDQRAVQLQQISGSMTGLPEHLAKESERLSREVCQQISLIAKKYWDAARAEVALFASAENEQSLSRVKVLEDNIAAATDRAAQAERERDRICQEFNVCIVERDKLAQECADLKAAVRNAESDLRATQRTIEGFERNREQDRDEIRRLQKRGEELLVELATVKADSLKADVSRKTTVPQKK
jgi:chromosome segregation ATPase